MVLPGDTLSEWATEQAKLVAASDLNAEHKALCAEIVLESGGSIRGLLVAQWGSVWLNSDELRHRFKGKSDIALFVGEVSYEDDVDPIPKFVFEEHFTPSDDIVFIPQIEFGERRSRLKQFFLEILEQEWGGYDEDFDDERPVGRADYEDIVRSVEILRRP